MIISPTVGRVVWFWPNENSAAGLNYHDKKQPLAAHVAYVWNDRMVNLLVIDQNGKSYSFTSVALAQDGDAVQGGQSYCEWMPYQKGQAAKVEELEKKQS